MFVQIGMGLDFAAKGLGDEQEHKRNMERAARDLPPIRTTSVSRKAAQRTGQPVRRHSHEAGRCEGTFWRPMDKRDARMIALAAEKYDRAGRQKGGTRPLGGVALEIIDLLANLMHRKTGRLEPSIDWLMDTLKRSRDAIVRGLKALRTHGFLDWLRRYVPTGNNGRGPQVKQTSNAYRLFMPARALRLLGRLGQPAPVPDDFSQARANRLAEIEAQQGALPLEERVHAIVEDDALAVSLARLGAAIIGKQRESDNRTESSSSSF